MRTFVFENYEFNSTTRTAAFMYSFDEERRFREEVIFNAAAESYDEATLKRALFLAFILTGVSYYKLFPGAVIRWQAGGIDEWQSGFMDKVYQEGLGQFAFENGLTRGELAHFKPTMATRADAVSYHGSGVLSLQSGGKDSLLTAIMLERMGTAFDSFYITSGDAHPHILDGVGERLYIARRSIDLTALRAGMETGGLNGHVPVTYIVMADALIQAVLLNKSIILASIGHEGEEAHEWIGDLPINHQWSKTWQGEQLFSEYVRRYISPDIKIGSPLRRYSELRIAELFAELAWGTYGHEFSSCNRANYRQGSDNTVLQWCGECPKCANFYLLFSPFIDAAELQGLFAGQDLYKKATLKGIFQGLLGIDGAMKPFECVGEVDELRRAYDMSQRREGYGKLGFDVPLSSYDYRQTYSSQDWSPLL